jgi:hypothetical protein
MRYYLSPVQERATNEKREMSDLLVERAVVS